ncbi:response regulator transcription factor [bacterium]|nr:response regulator transcription factor [bacterium]
MCQLLQEALEGVGFEVHTAASVREGKAALEMGSVDLVVLDVMMPEESGFELLSWMRREQQDSTPVILLTGVSAEEDKLRAFNLDADDYVVKPFSLPEFIARIRAVLRRSEARLPQVIEFGDCVIDRAARQVHRDGEEVKLRLKEYQILTTLAENPGVAISRQELFQRIWGEDSPSGEKTVDVTIHTLRDKIEEDPAHPRWIQTVRGYGYRFEPPEEESSSQKAE